MPRAWSRCSASRAYRAHSSVPLLARPCRQAGCEAAYAELRGQVEGGLRTLQDELRPADPYRELLPRGAWEALYNAQAPGPPGYDA